MVWYSHLLKNFPQFVVIHTDKRFSAVNEADVFPRILFFYDPTDVGNLISGSSAFSKYSLNPKKKISIPTPQHISSVQFSRSVVSDSLRPHESQHARPPCPSPTPGVHPDSRPVMPSSHLILCHPLLLLPPIPPSIRVFSNESTLHMRWPKYWSFSLASFLPKKSQG